ncbi:hypothetical protein MAPG_10157 [Magnaporthiopsis poae ATCC 64411]|uniref:Uncharacterized protein n=1 Tax=Magnaporthiopsis poae (strain ATCC 64411 / 73-15) TaxID=644358 RepID=A0A0C4EBU8_MAGP6|nr:hypothetical protein MAPG_10157 [Magnaporthiopsis poae ATCC 64411]
MIYHRNPEEQPLLSASSVSDTPVSASASRRGSGSSKASLTSSKSTLISEQAVEAALYNHESQPSRTVEDDVLPEVSPAGRTLGRRSAYVYSFILEVEAYPGQFMSFALAVGLLWLRYKRPDLKRPFRAWIPAVLLRAALALALIAAPFFPPAEPPASGLWYATYAIVGASILAFGVIYWYLWTILIPRWRGYRLEEKTETLADGMTITKLVHVPLNDS